MRPPKPKRASRKSIPETMNRFVTAAGALWVITHLRALSAVESIAQRVAEEAERVIIVPGFRTWRRFEAPCAWNFGAAVLAVNLPFSFRSCPDCPMSVLTWLRHAYTKQN